MIQDIGSHCYHNEYKPVPPRKSDYILCFHGRQVLVKTEENTICFPTFADIDDHLPNAYENYTFLFSIDTDNYYFVPAFDSALLPDFSFQDVVIFRSMGPQEKSFALITGFHLFNWYSSHRFCGTCGSKMVHDTKERMMFCPACQTTEYPKISPAVIVGVRNGNLLLLSKYAGKNAKRYALIAGFTEIGETLEQTVQREVMEEVGLTVKNIQYYKSQPWALSGSLLAGFYCDLDGDDTITLDKNELAVAQWFEREEIPYDDYDVSLTREMMLQFKKGMY